MWDSQRVVPSFIAKVKMATGQKTDLKTDHLSPFVCENNEGGGGSVFSAIVCYCGIVLCCLQ